MKIVIEIQDGKVTKIEMQDEGEVVIQPNVWPKVIYQPYPDPNSTANPKPWHEPYFVYIGSPHPTETHTTHTPDLIYWGNKTLTEKN